MRKISIIVIAAVLAAIVATPAEAVSSRPSWGGVVRSWSSGYYGDGRMAAAQTAFEEIGATLRSHHRDDAKVRIAAVNALADSDIMDQGVQGNLEAGRVQTNLPPATSASPYRATASNGWRDPEDSEGGNQGVKNGTAFEITVYVSHNGTRKVIKEADLHRGGWLAFSPEILRRTHGLKDLRVDCELHVPVSEGPGNPAGGATYEADWVEGVPRPYGFECVAVFNQPPQQSTPNPSGTASGAGHQEVK